MRNYNCFFSAMFDGKLKVCMANTCWSALKEPRYFDPAFISPYPQLYYNEKNYEFWLGHTIYIYNYDDPVTAAGRPLLLSTVNEITPCREVIIKKIKYIEFKLLATYDQSLVLLNFIRNLWHSPLLNYSEKFLEKLKEASQKDPLERLTWANKEACDKVVCGPGHSNVHQARNLKIKSVRDLLAYEQASTSMFLTT